MPARDHDGPDRLMSRAVSTVLLVALAVLPAAGRALTSDQPDPSTLAAHAAMAAAVSEPVQEVQEASAPKRTAVARAARVKKAAPAKPPAPPRVRAGKDLVKLALQFKGRWGGWPCVRAESDFVSGQCKQFVGCLLRVLNGKQRILGGDYYSSYATAGARRIHPSHAQPGDIIQLTRRGKARDGFRFGMHTAIVMDYKGKGIYRVVDANYLGERKVRVHTWNASKHARSFKLNLVVWRFP